MGRSDREHHSRRDQKKDKKDERKYKRDGGSHKRSRDDESDKEESHDRVLRKQERSSSRDNRRGSEKYDSSKRRDKKRNKRDEDESIGRHKTKGNKKRRYNDDESTDHDRNKKKKKQSRYNEDDQRHNSKKKKKKSKKDQSSRSLNSRHPDDKNDVISTTKKLNVDKSILFPLGESLGHAPEKLLDPEQDYFTFHQHFWLYLYREKQIAFNDLTTDQARKAFQDFVQIYNTGKLESAYYNEKGLPPQALDEIKTTRHKWGFHISDREGKNLQMLQEGVRKQTEYSNEPSSSNNNKDGSFNESKKRLSSTANDTNQGGIEAQAKGFVSERSMNRRLKEHVRTVEEELTGGRKEGRERQVENRKEVGAKIHGASQDRDDMMGSGAVLSDDVIFGSSDSDFQAALAAQKRRKQQQEEKQKVRLDELKAKEESKQQAMLHMLGLSDKIKVGEKIQIKPREDG